MDGKIAALLVCLVLLSGCLAPLPDHIIKNHNPFLLRVPAPPGVNLSFIDPASDRAGGCLFLSLWFAHYNPGAGWIFVSCTRTDPYTGGFASHAFIERGDLVWDPVENEFFERESYYSYFTVSNTSRYYE